jgi:hypothetical protein
VSGRVRERDAARDAGVDPQACGDRAAAPLPAPSRAAASRLAESWDSSADAADRGPNRHRIPGRSGAEGPGCLAARAAAEPPQIATPEGAIRRSTASAERRLTSRRSLAREGGWLKRFDAASAAGSQRRGAASAAGEAAPGRPGRSPLATIVPPWRRPKQTSSPSSHASRPARAPRAG